LAALIVHVSFCTLTIWLRLLMDVLKLKVEKLSLTVLMVHLKMIDSMILLHLLISAMVTTMEKVCLAALIVKQNILCLINS